MNAKINRRQMMVCGARAAGLLAGAPLVGLARQGQCALASAAGRSAEQPAGAPTSPVAVLRCESYAPQHFRQVLDDALDRIGGIQPLVRGKTVTVKLNLTGMSWKDLFGMPAYETYQTHPHTVAALCAALVAAGARRIVLVESLYWAEPLEKTLQQAGWDVAAIRAAGDHRVTFEDTRHRGQWPSYSRFKVPWGGFVYPAFDLNQRYEKTDVLISLAKLKQHACAGITGAVKNFFGIAPCSLYGNDAPSEDPRSHRTEMFHSGRKRVPAGVPAELNPGVPNDPAVRVPRIVADIYGARPADLGIVEGVRSIAGGEGHWNRGVRLVEPKLLVVGRNGVCTDAIATAVMGFNPQAAHGRAPFPGENHLRLLAEKGIGTNDPAEIELTGLSLKEAVYPYQPHGAAASG